MKNNTPRHIYHQQMERRYQVQHLRCKQQCERGLKENHSELYTRGNCMPTISRDDSMLWWQWRPAETSASAAVVLQEASHRPAHGWMSLPTQAPKPGQTSHQARCVGKRGPEGQVCELTTKFQRLRSAGKTGCTNLCEITIDSLIMTTTAVRHVNILNTY